MATVDPRTEWVEVIPAPKDLNIYNGHKINIQLKQKELIKKFMMSG